MGKADWLRGDTGVIGMIDISNRKKWIDEIRIAGKLDRTDKQIVETALAFTLQSLREDPECLKRFRWR